MARHSESAQTAPSAENAIAAQLVGGPNPPKRAMNEKLQDALRAIRTHLDMQVAFISEFAGEQRTLRYVDCDSVYEGVAAGASAPLSGTYCKRVVEGTLPALAARADVSAIEPDPVLTRAVPIASYASVPIRLSDGTVYGTFCAIGTAADDSLNDRDLKVMRAFADMAAAEIETDLARAAEQRKRRERIQRVLGDGVLSIVYQPIVDLRRGEVIGYESLSRFDIEPKRSPDVWFGEADSVGLGEALELVAIERALAGIGAAPPGTYVSVNASPAHVLSGKVEAMLTSVAPHRVVLEITEHAAISDYSVMLGACAKLRQRGIRLAIDDAGSGYASFRHILSLEPNFIKLDATLTRGVSANARQQALVAAFVAFAAKTQSELIAEGIETAEELDMLKRLGVAKGQGYLLGRPAPFA